MDKANRGLKKEIEYNLESYLNEAKPAKYELKFKNKLEYCYCEPIEKEDLIKEKKLIKENSSLEEIISYKPYTAEYLENKYASDYTPIVKKLSREIAEEILAELEQQTQWLKEELEKCRREKERQRKEQARIRQLQKIQQEEVSHYTQLTQEHKAWEELTEFAKEQGAKVVGNLSNGALSKLILLPLGQVAGIEYGTCITSELDDPITYTLQGDKLTRGDRVWCYTPQIIIKTAEVGDDRYVIEKKAKRDKDLDKARALMLAFKFRDLGTIDPSYLKQAYSGILKLLPEDLCQELIENKLSQLEEKLEEVEALRSELPESDKIIDNIIEEFEAYMGMGVKLKNVEFPKLIEKVWSYYADNLHLYLESFASWLPKDIAEKLLTNTISELKEELESFTLKESGQVIQRTAEKFTQYAKIAKKIEIEPDINLPNLTKRLTNKIVQLEEDIKHVLCGIGLDENVAIEAFVPYFEVMYKTAQILGIKPSVKIPYLAKKTCLYFINKNSFVKIPPFMGWCVRTDNKVNLRNLNKAEQISIEAWYNKNITNARYTKTVYELTGVKPKYDAKELQKRYFSMLIQRNFDGIDALQGFAGIKPDFKSEEAINLIIDWKGKACSREEAEKSIDEEIKNYEKHKAEKKAKDNEMIHG